MRRLPPRKDKPWPPHTNFEQRGVHWQHRQPRQHPQACNVIQNRLVAPSGFLTYRPQFTMRLQAAKKKRLAEAKARRRLEG